jgi:hypothetical protein
MDKTYNKKALTYKVAAKMVEAAIARATELNCKQNVAVVDDGGNLKAFGRMDSAPLLGTEGRQIRGEPAYYTPAWSRADWSCQVQRGAPQ